MDDFKRPLDDPAGGLRSAWDSLCDLRLFVIKRMLPSIRGSRAPALSLAIDP